MHHFDDKDFCMRNLCRPLILASLLLSLTGCPDPVVRDSAAALDREQFGISVLSVNLLDALNTPRASSTGVPWQTRYTRISDWMTQTGNFPDVIVLQEAPGYWSCAGNGRQLPDYAAIDFLLDGIRMASGEQYRVAYLIGGTPHGSHGSDWMGTASVGGCSTQGERALLYRPSRLRNVITSPGSGDTVVSAYQIPLQSTYLARSLQCCHPAADRTDVCSVIDGPLSTPMAGEYEGAIGTCATPLGAAFARSRLATQGENRQRPTTDAVFTRFELVNQPGNFVHIYNVHRGWNQDWEDRHHTPAPQVEDFGSQNINALVTDMEGRFRRGDVLYPPILVGDFNVGLPAPGETFPLLTSYFPRFDIGDFFRIDGVMFGKAADFPSKRPAYANLMQHMPSDNCEDPATLWSDHCGIYFRVEPSRR
ncbi:hypothetical protein [Lysobacter sp. CFH 32150]|uniref:hypothetical protein n=1 Tax=Lysobacter sp. CFH 32150 TaxID=2927128 RepID=UPI001FA743AD|nr:hypothetical protein [Lysobacter sp. CFH 32150]MCI4568515.1 hypothetical protein [Lysobacter sp. CFH 32150]